MEQARWQAQPPGSTPAPGAGGGVHPLGPAVVHHQHRGLERRNSRAGGSVQKVPMDAALPEMQGHRVCIVGGVRDRRKEGAPVWSQGGAQLGLRRLWRFSSLVKSGRLHGWTGDYVTRPVFSFLFLDYWQVTLIWSPYGDVSLIRSFTYWWHVHHLLYWRGSLLIRWLRRSSLLWLRTAPLLIYNSAWLVPRHAWLISLLS